MTQKKSLHAYNSYRRISKYVLIDQSEFMCMSSPYHKNHIKHIFVRTQFDICAKNINFFEVRKKWI
jgi:hypothetical protein